MLAHGTTVATNALLERRGARVALVTNAGFADVIEIARQDRPSLYDPCGRPARAARAPRAARSRSRAASAPDGWRDRAARPDARPIPEGVEAVAVCLLHSDLAARPRDARRRWSCEAEGHDVSCSRDVSPEFREYERTVTTVVNAYLRPVCRAYLQRLVGRPPTRCR